MHQQMRASKTIDRVVLDNGDVAAGFNSALARTGGLVATAFLGPALAKRGDDLTAAFHTAAITGCVAALAAAVCAWFLVGQDG